MTYRWRFPITKANRNPLEANIPFGTETERYTITTQGLQAIEDEGTSEDGVKVLMSIHNLNVGNASQIANDSGVEYSKVRNILARAMKQGYTREVSMPTRG